MKIDKNLNMVVPVECDDGSTVYVHSAPISKESFDQNFWVMGAALNAIYNGGLGHTMAPRVAAKVLLEVADKLDRRPSAEAVLADVRRLTSVLVLHEGRWVQMPFADAVSRDIIDARDADEVENAIAFFTLASAVHKAKDAVPILTEAAKLWSAQLTSSNSTAFAASLPTSTQAGSTGARVPPSSIPS